MEKQSENNIIIKIIPIGELLFRDTTSFNKKESNWVISKKIPNLSVLYGAIISMQLRKGKFKNAKEMIQNIAKGNTEKQKEIDKELKNKICIRGIYLTDGEKLYIPAPFDLFYFDCEGGRKIARGIYEDGICYPPEEHGIWREEWERVENKYISLEDYYEGYVDGELDDIELVDEDYFFTYYHKVGIEKDVNGSTKKEHLYYMDMVTFQSEEMGYVIEIDSEESLSFSKDGELIHLGGERRTAFIEEMTRKEVKILEKCKRIDNNAKYVKLIFTAPFLLSGESEDKIKIFDEERNINIKLKVINKVEYAGGYNIANKTQKQVRKVIPSGSVLLLDMSNVEKDDGVNLYDYIKYSFYIQKEDKYFSSFFLIEESENIGKEEKVYERE